MAKINHEHPKSVIEKSGGEVFIGKLNEGTGKQEVQKKKQKSLARKRKVLQKKRGI